MVNDVGIYGDGLTISHIKNLEKKYGFSPSKALGQNFLIDINISKKIVNQTLADNNVIEIGPGLGSLTTQLAKSHKSVTVVELDKYLLNPLEDVLSSFKIKNKVEVLNEDAMKMDFENLCIKTNSNEIVGNLPYNISGPLIAELSKNVNKCNHMVFMVQKEVGERLAASQGTRSVSSITLKTQYFMEIKMLFSVPKTAFYPAPNVDSVVIELTRRKSDDLGINENDIVEFFKLIDSAFSQRRKTLRKSLQSFIGSNIDDVLDQAHVDSKLRAEACDLECFARIYKAYKNEM